MGGPKAPKKKKREKVPEPEYAELASNVPDNEPIEFNSPVAAKENEYISPRKEKKPIKIIRESKVTSPNKHTASKRYKENELSSANIESDRSPARRNLEDIHDDIDNLDIAIDTKSCGTMESEESDGSKENYGSFAANMQEKLFEIIENEEVEDVVDLNQKFLAQSFGVDEDQLAILPKIELRVDTRCHNL